MTNTPDMTAMFKDVLGAFPMDNSAMKDAFKNTATLNEKLSSVAFDAADKSADISSAWTKDTLTRLTAMTAAKNEPTDYAKAMTEFASSSAEAAAEHMAAFAEIAKKVQMETVELMMAAGKDMQNEVTATATKTAEKAQAATQKSATK